MFRVSVLLLFILHVPLARAEVLFTDFDDLIDGTQFASGDAFVSNGVRFDVVDVPPSVSGNARVIVSSFSGGTGNELRGAGIEVDLPATASEVSMMYGNFSPSGRIVINGDASPAVRLFSDFDGTVLGGVSISATPSIDEPQRGQMTLSGPINSLVLGGSEFGMDNLRITIPEPGSLALTICALMPSALLRRRRSSP